MDHERLLARAVFSDIFQFEALRQIEIELDRGKLPQTPDRIHQLDINLRPVKRRFARNGLVLDLHSLEDTLKRCRRHIPLVFAADVTLAIVRIPNGKLGLELVEAKIP